MKYRHKLVCLLLLTLGWAALTSPDCRAAKRRQYKKAIMIRFQGDILPLSERYLYRKLDDARARGADLIVLDIDSPGGMLGPTLNMATRLRELKWAHSVAFISDEALSGAAIMSLGCDEIIMHPRARFGDAGPIFLGEDALFRHAPEKIRSDLVRRVRDLATAKHRPPALAEAMVDNKTLVYRVENTETGDVTYMSQQEIDTSENPDIWKRGKLVPESNERVFLEVNGARAVELQIASATVENRRQLAQHFKLQQPFLILQPNGVDQAVDILNSPLITGLLFVVGLIALYVEFSAPGIGLGGLTAGLCFALFFWSRFLGGTAGWLEIVLVLAGLIFLGMEFFVIPGFGVPGITGFLLVIAGIVMASQTHLIPDSRRAVSQLENSLIVIAVSGVVFFAAAVMISRHFGSLPLLNRLILTSPAAVDRGDAAPADKPEPTPGTAVVAVGDWGVADSYLRPAGKAVFDDQYVDVVTDGSFVEQGRQVRVIEIRGNVIRVREVEDNV